MGNQIQITVALVLMVKIIHMQDPTIEIITEKPFKCKSSLKMKCTPNDCCPLLNKFWWKDSVRIINSGMSTVPSKYSEFNATTYLEFTLHNLEGTDFGSEYRCSYDSRNSPYITLSVDDYFCPPCWDCGGTCVGFSMIGVVILIVIVALISKSLGTLKDKFLIVTVVTCAAGLTVDVIATLCIGGYTCLCEYGKGFTCIFIGFGITLPVVIVVVLIFYFISAKGNTRKDPQGSKADSNEEMKLNEPVNL